MKDDVALIALSLFSIFLFTFHWAYEITNGLEAGGTQGLFGIGILVVWLYGTLLGARRSGYIIMLIGGLFGFGVLLAHMQGHGMVGPRISTTSGILYWVWTLILLGVSSSISFILAAQLLWKSRVGRPR